MIALVLALALAPAQDPAESARRVIEIARDQDRLRDKLARLAGSISALETRLRQEGRVRAADLLEDARRRLAAAGEDGSTLVERMARVAADLEKGRALRAAVEQQGLVTELEKLLDVLLDRGGTEPFEEQEAELAALSAEAGALLDAERELRRRTAELEESLVNPARLAIGRAATALAQAQEAEARDRSEPADSLRELAHDLEQLRAAVHPFRQALPETETEADMTAVAMAGRGLAREAERIGRLAGNEAAGRSDEAPEQGPLLQAAQLLAAAADQLDLAVARMQDGATPAAQASVQAAEQALADAQESLAAAAASRGDGEAAAQGAREAAARQEALRQATEALRDQAVSMSAGGSEDAARMAQAAQALERAVAEMEAAVRDIERMKREPARPRQEAAAEALRQAGAAARGGASGSQEQRGQLAEQQEEIRERILELARRMAERGNAGAQSAESAASSAGNAGEQLRRGNLGEAQEEERDVEEALEDTVDEVEEERDRYRELRQEELLFQMWEELNGMLEQHRTTMVTVHEVENARGKQGSALPRSARLRLRSAARTEADLAGDCARVSTAIKEEGAAVYAWALRLCEEDLNAIAMDLGPDGGWQTGDQVRSRQSDVEERLVELLAALESEQQSRREERGQRQESPASQRLVSAVAELRMLRGMQVDVRERIDSFLRLHPEIGGDDPPAPLLAELDRLAVRQERIHELFLELKAGFAPPTEDDR